MKTDTKLKQLLARMLPNKYRFEDETQTIRAISGDCRDNTVKDTELLHVCYLIEEGLSLQQRGEISHAIYTTNDRAFSVVDCENNDDWEAVFMYMHATWQQRCDALATIKGLQ